MYSDSSPDQSLRSPSLSSSSDFLKQVTSRRSLIKALTGLVIMGVEGELVACSSNNTSVSSIPTGIKLFTYNGHSDFVFAAAWSPQNQYIASGGEDKTVQVWNAVNGVLQSTYQHQAIVTSVVWSPDGNNVASGGDNGIVNVWDTTSSTKAQKAIWTLNGEGNLWGLEWSPLDGKFIAIGVGSGKHVVKIYDTSNKTLKLTCEGQAGNIWNVAWSPDGKYIAAACQDNTVQIFDIENNGRTKLNFKLHKSLVWGVDWSPDGRYIASGGFDNMMFVWDAKDGRVVFSGEHSDIVYGVTWSPDGTYIASASRDRLVRIWDFDKRSNTIYYDGHSGAVYRNSWSPEGKRIVSAYRDGTVQIWKLPF